MPSHEANAAVGRVQDLGNGVQSNEKTEPRQVVTTVRVHVADETQSRQAIGESVVDRREELVERQTRRGFRTDYIPRVETVVLFWKTRAAASEHDLDVAIAIEIPGAWFSDQGPRRPTGISHPAACWQPVAKNLGVYWYRWDIGGRPYARAEE
jgi:hypothetical protein